MYSKPEYFGTYYAEAFKHHAVVDAYRYRPPYPKEVFDVLSHLMTDEPRTLLDVGAGSGDVARHCFMFAERIDAVDFSQSMIEQGKRLPNGNHPHLHWVYGKIEEVPLTPPYSLITAGSSIHWTQWSLAFPRFRRMLSPHGYLALLHRGILPMPWDEELRNLRVHFSTRHDRGSAHVLPDLEAGGFFLKKGQKETAPVPFVQSLDDFIEGLHSRSGLAKERMGQDKAAAFDQQVRELILPYCEKGMLSLRVVGTVTWGIPDEGK